MAPSTVFFIHVLFVSITLTETSLTTENILINVIAGTPDTQEPYNLQINLNLSIGEEQILVNNVPVELSAVTRLNCQALLLDSTNGSEYGGGDLVSTVTRVMVTQNRLYSDAEEVVALQVFSEVIELEGKMVQQPDMCEVKILMSPDFQKLAQFTNIYPIGHSEIFRVSRENDVVVTDATNHKKEEQMMSQTTSQYPLKHSDTTQEEFAAPGKLPETPLRMDPDVLNDVRYEETEDADLDQHNQVPMETSPKEFISYSAICRWVDDFRERLRHFCSESLPLFFLVMWVVVIGVVGSAVIVKILDLCFPVCEHKHIFHLNSLAVVPEDEKHTLLEGLEEDDERKP
ncbi:glycoprotein integral membrane protein 1 [Dunckerocampus dactyliophorus]|uniref:glycoprotein integral membrane protein 1 n=1 Tax=Dunckerocampus dactyliophorus TaxID=161453 RepID=UPI0024065DB2|nr:glycoprotein integral membrane protein 1 [Dunckerocampus dactyliophorus]